MSSKETKTDRVEASSETKEEPLVLRFGGALVEQLGAQLYPSATAAVAELVSNAWDADAKNVWITMPFNAWSREASILVFDDGNGMTREEARLGYLVVGRRRRTEKGVKSDQGRLVHGRKGIGKLAAFGTAAWLECVTIRDGHTTGFILDYDQIRRLQPAEDYRVQPPATLAPLINPDTKKPLDHGTRITLKRLSLKRVLTEETFMRSLSRRFALSSADMRIVVNGKALTRFDLPVQFKFPRDAAPEGVTAEDGWAIEKLPGGEVVRWWIGFTEKPLDDEANQGISVLANGKMAQRPFKFERGQGTEGQLGQEYLVGEVQADWLDRGSDIEDDLIQSNRDQLQIEDQRLDSFIEWGRGRLAWALRERNRLRRKTILDRFEASKELEKLLENYSRREREKMLQIAAVASKLPEISSDQVEDLMEDIVNSRSDQVVRDLMDEIVAEPEETQDRIWALVAEFGLIDARRTLSIVEARLGTIKRLRKALKKGAKEVPDLHDIIRKDTWLLDPRWHLLDDELDLATLDVDFEPETDEKTGDRLDFLFVLQPRPPAKIDEAVVVEIKRGHYPDGRERTANHLEVDKFHGYCAAVKDHYAKSTDRPTVRGLMIAQDYTTKAERIRKSLETRGDPRLEFRTWDRVIEDSERMHVGWLKVSKRRLKK
jgi:Histidine kinase-, DNA gyrase B-, and HSP90-like ATPase